MKATIYDHKGQKGVLRKWAEERASQHDDVEVISEENQASAVELLLKSEHPLLIVHLEPNHWNSLMDKVRREVSVFRLSTVGFAPTPPVGKHANGFHVNPRTENNEGKPENEALLPDVFANVGQEDVLNALRLGTIPLILRPFIQFHEPHLARALHIFIQGRLAQWALDPGHPLRAQANEVVGFDAVSMRSSGDFDWIGVLRRMLESGSRTDSKDKHENDDLLIKNSLNRIRDELSQKKDSDDTPIKEVKAILESWLRTSPSLDHAQRIEQDEGLFPILKDAFNALDKSLGRAKEGAA